MTIIELKNGYFIEIDKMCYTLKQKYIGKGKDGKERQAEKTYGYFGDMRKLIKKYLEYNQIDILDGEKVTMEEYVKAIETSNKLSVQFLKPVLEKFEIK